MSHAALEFERIQGPSTFPITRSRAIARSPDLSWLFSACVSVAEFGFPMSAMTRDLGDSGALRAPSPLHTPSQIGVHFRGVHPRSTQIGVDFSDQVTIGVGLTGFSGHPIIRCL